MNSTLIHIHESQYPGNVQKELASGLEKRVLSPKFHYLSGRQTQAWLKLHQAYSPSRTDRETSFLYQWAVEQVCSALKGRAGSGWGHYFGVGCGGGKKDALFLGELISSGGRRWRYFPMDVGVNMVLEATNEVTKRFNRIEVVPWVADFLLARDLIELAEVKTGEVDYRVLTFLGMAPNLPPDAAFQMIRQGLRTGDWLVVSANLAPGEEYRAGVERVFEQYDNVLTRDWLSLLMVDLGFQIEDGTDHPIKFSIEEFPAGSGWMRIVARWHVSRDSRIGMGERGFEFEKGEVIEIFYSYRFTPELFSGHLEKNGLRVVSWRQTESEEEGVFICQRV